MNKPQILLADEPTGNLDPVTSAGIMTLLERINASGTTVVMATHEAGIVDQMQRRVIELSAGRRRARRAQRRLPDARSLREPQASEADEADAPSAGHARRPMHRGRRAEGDAPRSCATPQPLYVEPEATDAVTDAAAAITAAATRVRSPTSTRVARRRRRKSARRGIRRT